MKPCRNPRCLNLVDKEKYCVDCNKIPVYNNRPSASKRGYDRRWRRESKEYLRSHLFCVECLRQGFDRLATVVDHVIPHKGDPKLFWDKSNWQPLCKPCNSRKAASEEGAFGNKMKLREGG